MIIEALSNKGRSEICLLSAFTMGSTIMIRCLGIDAAPLLPIITAALNRLQPPLKHAALFFFSSSSFFYSSFCLTNSLSADRAGDLCLGGLFSFLSFQGLSPPEPHCAPDVQTVEWRRRRRRPWTCAHSSFTSSVCVLMLLQPQASSQVRWAHTDSTHEEQEVMNQMRLHLWVPPGMLTTPCWMFGYWSEYIWNQR